MNLTAHIATAIKSARLQVEELAGALHDFKEGKLDPEQSLISDRVDQASKSLTQKLQTKLNHTELTTASQTVIEAIFQGLDEEGLHRKPVGDLIAYLNNTLMPDKPIKASYSPGSRVTSYTEQATKSVPSSTQQR